MMRAMSKLMRAGNRRARREKKLNLLGRNPKRKCPNERSHAGHTQQLRLPCLPRDTRHHQDISDAVPPPHLAMDPSPKPTSDQEISGNAIP